VVICPNPILFICNNCGYKEKITWNCIMLPNCKKCGSNSVESKNIKETIIYGKMEELK